MNKSSNELSRRKLRNMILKTVHNYKNTSDKIPNADMREIYDGIISFSEYNYARYLIKKCKKNIPDYYLNNLNSFISKEYLDKLSDEKHNRLAEKSSVENASSMSINEDNQKILDELEKRIWDSNVSLSKENLYNPSNGRHRHLAEKSRHFSAPVENAPSYSMLISEDDQKMLDEREKMFEDHNETSPNSKILTKGIRLSDIFAEGSYAYETYATKYDTIIEKQKIDIDEGNEQDYSKNAREFTKLMNEALNDDKLTKTEKQSVLVIMNAQAPLFWNAAPRKDEQDYFLKEDQGKYNTSVLDEWLVKNGIVASVDFNKTNGGDKSKNEYVDSDKKDAKKYAGMADEDEPKLYEEGGKKISGSKGKTEMVSETTIKTSCCKKPVVVSDKDLTKKTETSKGGSVVSITEKIGSTTKISEKFVPPETESEKLVEETTTVVDENGDTVLVDDEYPKYKSQKDKWLKKVMEMNKLGSFLATNQKYKDKDINKKDPEKK